jgi:hypothetical protein
MIFSRLCLDIFFISLLLNVISFSLFFMDLSLSHDLDPESSGLTQVDLESMKLLFLNHAPIKLFFSRLCLDIFLSLCF